MLALVKIDLGSASNSSVILSSFKDLFPSNITLFIIGFSITRINKIPSALGKIATSANKPVANKVLTDKSMRSSL